MRGKKLKTRKLLIFGIAVLIAVLNISMYSGNNQKVSVVIVKGDINTSKTLDKQLENFDVIQVTKNDFARMGDSLVTSESELTGKRITTKLDLGSPVPRAMLISGNGFGQFASETKLHTTVFKFPGAVAQLPSGIKSGDKIDVSFITKDTSKDTKINLLMTNVPVYSVTDTDVYVKVTQNDFDILTVVGKNSEFVLQLPGQKNVPNCKDLTPTQIQEKTDCYNEGDKPGTMTFSQVIQEVSNGVILGSNSSTSTTTSENATDSNSANQNNLSSSQTQTTNQQTQQDSANRKVKDSQLSNFKN